MVDAIKNDTWISVPSQITLARICQWYFCRDQFQLSKSDKLPREEASGSHLLLPGKVISVSYQGEISPTSVRGFFGFSSSV